MEQPAQITQAKVVMFGRNKAISALTFEAEGGKLEVGAIFHIPTRVEDGKTFYKALACKIEVTEAERIELIKMLGGIYLPISPALKGEP